MKNTESAVYKNWLSRIATALFIVSAFLGFGAHAQSNSVPAKNGDAPLEIKLTQWKVVTDAKKGESFVEAKTIKPGDVLEYRAVYSNVSKSAIKSLAATLPLPEGLEYVEGSSKPSSPAALAATKDERYAAQPLIQEVKDKNGKTLKERVPLSDYRFLRWTVAELPAGKTLEVKARARVGSAQAEREPQASQAPPGVRVTATNGAATQK